MKLPIAPALLACLVSVHAVTAATPTGYVLEVANDFEGTPDTIASWPGRDDGTDCLAENGIGYNQSRGLRFTYSGAQHIGPPAEFMFNAPALEPGTADGLMFWIKTLQPLTISISASGGQQGVPRFLLADGVRLADINGRVLDPSEYLIKHDNNQRSIQLEGFFEGWIILPNSVSPDGTGAGWRQDDPSWATAFERLDRITDLAIWSSSAGEIHIDQLCLYQKPSDEEAVSTPTTGQSGDQ
jgi:hypothetical protein